MKKKNRKLKRNDIARTVLHKNALEKLAKLMQAKAIEYHAKRTHNGQRNGAREFQDGGTRLLPNAFVNKISKHFLIFGSMTQPFPTLINEKMRLEFLKKAIGGNPQVQKREIEKRNFVSVTALRKR